MIASLSIDGKRNGLIESVPKFFLTLGHYPEFEPELEHRIGVGLAELELAQSAVRSLTHHKMLPGGVDVTETELQRVGIEERSAACGLERDSGHSLCHIGDRSRGRTRLGLSGRQRRPPGLSLSVYA